MTTFVATLPRGTRKPRTREFQAADADEARRQACLYWKVRTGGRLAIAVAPKDEAL